jgi:predicted transcriptional regulator
MRFSSAASIRGRPSCDTIEGLMGRMTTGKFRHMPVVEQGKLIGIVSIGDVVKNRVEEIEHESEALGDYIHQ